MQLAAPMAAETVPESAVIDLKQIKSGLIALSTAALSPHTA